MNTDKANITDKALKVSDNSDNIDQKIVNIEKENQIDIYNDTTDTSNDTTNDTSNDTSNDAKPNIGEKTFFKCMKLRKQLIKV